MELLNYIEIILKVLEMSEKLSAWRYVLLMVVVLLAIVSFNLANIILAIKF